MSEPAYTINVDVALSSGASAEADTGLRRQAEQALEGLPVVAVRREVASSLTEQLGPWARETGTTADQHIRLAVDLRPGTTLAQTAQVTAETTGLLQKMTDSSGRPLVDLRQSRLVPTPTSIAALQTLMDAPNPAAGTRGPSRTAASTLTLKH